MAAFNYGAMSSPDAEKVRATAARIRQSVAAHYREVGELLIEAKALLPRGAFAAWARHELGIEPRTAQRYVSAALFLRDKDDTLSRLPIATIYALADRITPEHVVKKVVADAEAGRTLDPKAIVRSVEAGQAEVKKAMRSWRVSEPRALELVQRHEERREADALRRAKVYAEEARQQELRIASPVWQQMKAEREAAWKAWRRDERAARKQAAQVAVKAIAAQHPELIPLLRLALGSQERAHRAVLDNAEAAAVCLPPKRNPERETRATAANRDAGGNAH
ncbi:hypothetical protein VQH23_26545 (plasmid) [Pararoseomonas sp. SCSIO 73927]|uniref:hypothetical protein n=1 Tax=Pararoseomonas sp. SCSIO 73927 TaxID=3114537 RepID=UPI0030D1DD91